MKDCFIRVEVRVMVTDLDADMTHEVVFKEGTSALVRESWGDTAQRMGAPVLERATRIISDIQADLLSTP